MSRRRSRPPVLPPPEVEPTYIPPYQRVVYTQFPSAFLENQRAVTISLPPGYDADAQARYPVFYLHDGQNLFEHHEAAFGVAWRADATAARLIAMRRIRPVILVGIANTPDRLNEYARKYDAHERIGGRGEPYARFVLDEVKPFVDRHYRTLAAREHTAVAGSSMGGLVSLTMAQDHCDRFGLCGVISPSLWWNHGGTLREIEEGDKDWLRRMRFWVDMGTREGSRRGHVPPAIERTRELIHLFDMAGLLPGRDYYYFEVAGGEHNETHWSARFDRVLLYFFGI
jgi:predicted alpha/beta superfamily hydrolase